MYNFLLCTIYIRVPKIHNNLGLTANKFKKHTHMQAIIELQKQSSKSYTPEKHPCY